jgi:hypothetical protein
MRPFARPYFGGLIAFVAATVSLSAQTPTTLSAIGDTYLKAGQPNQNQGAETLLTVQSSGNNRTLVRFDQAAIGAALGAEPLASATLRLYVDFNADNWGPDGRPVNVHRMTDDWTELGATWNCAVDSDTANGGPDCDPQWEMGSGP